MKKLQIADGYAHCECGGRSFNMEIKGSLEFGIRLEVDELLMDEPDFNYNYAEPTSVKFYCNNCGKEFKGAKELYNGEAKV